MVINYLPFLYSSSLSNQQALLGYNIAGNSNSFNQVSTSTNSFSVFSQNGNTGRFSQIKDFNWRIQYFSF